jgi:hypothetical protein
VCMKRLQVGLRAFTVLISAMNRSWRHCGVVLMGRSLGRLERGKRRELPWLSLAWRRFAADCVGQVASNKSCVMTSALD